MSPAEELMAAAEHIREIAKAATPGVWVDLDRGDRIMADDGTSGFLQYVVDEPLVANPDNGAHIALWDPPTAELVAQLLEGMVEYWGARPIADLDVYLMTPLGKLARALLGGAR